MKQQLLTVVFPMDESHACFQWHMVQRMTSTLEKAIHSTERLAADDAQDYLLHIFGGRLEEMAERARLSPNDFADIVYAHAANSKARARAAHEREAVRLAERMATKQPSKGLERQCAVRELDIGVDGV